jgi:hypothetical protein
MKINRFPTIINFNVTNNTQCLIAPIPINNDFFASPIYVDNSQPYLAGECLNYSYPKNSEVNVQSISSNSQYKVWNIEYVISRDIYTYRAKII